MKLIIFQIILLISTGLLINQGETEVIQWVDLGIIFQIRLISGLIFMVLLGIAAIVIFRSVWVKNGYAGIDEILVDKEVGLFMSHVLAFALLEVFIFMILFYDYIQPPQYVFWICGAGFLSPEVVQSLHFVMDLVKNKKQNQ